MLHDHHAPHQTSRRTPLHTPLQDHNSDDKLHDHLLNIISVSAGMLGVCLTAIGLIGVIKATAEIETLCDEILAANSFLYLGTAIISFIALRTPLRKRAIGLTFLVDVLFCLGLILSAIACGLLVMIVL
ncbi:hypothetical protein [Lacipirellula limnantheis]|uniref:DUF4064 domain-containing protein n=1 Tax=Lacipirellula limnantheis TaxID=2528024 RepID=A0A517TZQ2_9BACT|nr:hypothetical protein [Lacipirellula limnantheis]QDT73859.1 hypothetical protein I41_30500 [Lacipirellula limnantheis]